MSISVTGRAFIIVATVFILAGVLSIRAQEQNNESEKALQGINSLSEMMIPKDEIPKDWKLLEKRVIRNSLDKDLPGMADITVQMLQSRIKDSKCQSFQVENESFNVDIFWVEKGLEKLMEVLEEHIHSPVNQTGDTKEQINWIQKKYEKVLIVISTSDQKLQKQVVSKYTKLWFGLIESKATKCIKDKKEDTALNYFKIILPDVSDIGRAYMILAGLYLHDASEPADAVSCYEKCLTYASKAKFTDQELWDIYEGMALSAIKIPDVKKGEKAFLKSYEIAQKIKDDKLTSESSYNLACIYAEIKDKEKTYKYLEISFKIDSKRAKDALDDSSFKELQKEDRFNNLVKKYSKE